MWGEGITPWIFRLTSVKVKDVQSLSIIWRIKQSMFATLPMKKVNWGRGFKPSDDILFFVDF